MISPNGMPPNSDRDLVTAAAKGQVAAFATLVGRYRDVHTRYAIRMLGAYDAADEALQTAFVRGFQSLARAKEPDQFSDWLFRIVINECRARALRRAVREGRLTGETEAVSASSARPNTDGGAEAQRALDQIDPINREAFILQYIEELTYPQIATLTGVSVVTLERQVDRACARLRELLPHWHREHREEMTRPVDGAGKVGPSFPVRVALPLRRAEVLNDSFDDRLMAKLLRPGESHEVPPPLSQPAAPPITVVPKAAPAPSVKAPARPAAAPPSLFVLRRRPTFAQIAGMGAAAALIALAFAAGDALRGRSDAKARAGHGTKAAAASPRIVRRTDTVRVSHSDTILFARFVLSDEKARAVSVIGDFNRWDASATPLARVGAGSWATTMRLKPGRFEYAFLVDGKHWVTDRFARTIHDEFETQSSVIATATATTGAGTGTDGSSASARIKKVLPRSTAERVLSAVAGAKSDGLPALALENRTLKLAANHVAPKDIERAIAGEAERMRRAHMLLAAADRREPSDGEIVAAAELLRRDTDTAGIGALARSVPANRALDVPFHVSGQLIASDMSPHDALARVQERLRSGATDMQLEHLLDEPVTRVAAQKSGKGKASRVSKSTSSATVRQAGAPAKTHTTKPRHKTSGT